MNIATVPQLNTVTPAFFGKIDQLQESSRNLYPAMQEVNADAFKVYLAMTEQIQSLSKSLDSLVHWSGQDSKLAKLVSQSLNYPLGASNNPIVTLSYHSPTKCLQDSSIGLAQLLTALDNLITYKTVRERMSKKTRAPLTHELTNQVAKTVVALQEIIRAFLQDTNKESQNIILGVLEGKNDKYLNIKSELHKDRSRLKEALGLTLAS